MASLCARGQHGRVGTTRRSPLAAWGPNRQSSSMRERCPTLYGFTMRTWATWQGWNYSQNSSGGVGAEPSIIIHERSVSNAVWLHYAHVANMAGLELLAEFLWRRGGGAETGGGRWAGG